MAESVTKSAFCQARKKMLPSFYLDFFHRTQQLFYSHFEAKRFKTYLLLACDTTVQKLPNNTDTRHLGTHTNQSQTVASIKLCTYYDVLNQVITSAAHFEKNTADLRCVQGYIKQLPNDTISIYDRGFASLLLPFLHSHFNTKYVIRLPVGFSNTVVAFMKNTDNEIVVNELLTQKCFWELAKLGIRKSQHNTVLYRLVKVILPTGETEILMTNLGEDFTIDDLNFIYQHRWGVETSYNYVKNTFMLGTFSGYSQEVVLQDIYCVLSAFNLQTILQYECQETLDTINKRRKSVYKINRNVGAGSIRLYLRRLFLSSPLEVESAVFTLQTLLLKSLEKVKPCHKERRRKQLRCNDRHQTELNYKRGF